MHKNIGCWILWIKKTDEKYSHNSLCLEYSTFWTKHLFSDYLWYLGGWQYKGNGTHKDLLFIKKKGDLIPPPIYVNNFFYEEQCKHMTGLRFILFHNFPILHKDTNYAKKWTAQCNMSYVNRTYCRRLH